MKNVFLIGAMKSGTNTLYDALRMHPAVAVPQKKELDYFVKHTRDTPYPDHFEITADTEVTLDGTTQYSKHPQFRHIPEMIRAMNPQARIIYLMRDPVDRYESNIAHHIARDEGVGANDWAQTKKAAAALDYGRYYTQIGPYLRLFGPERTFLGVFEDFVADQQTFIAQVYEFLGLEPLDVRRGDTHRNPRRRDRGADSFQLTRQDEIRVARDLRNDIDCLEHTMAVDTERWWKRYHWALEQ